MDPRETLPAGESEAGQALEEKLVLADSVGKARQLPDDAGLVLCVCGACPHSGFAAFN